MMKFKERSQTCASFRGWCRAVGLPGVFLGSLLWFPMAFAQGGGDYVQGVHYFELETPTKPRDPGRIEVVEVFWYGCPHCYYLEPRVRRWAGKLAEDVNFVKLPAGANPTWSFHARLYYVAQNLGLGSRADDAIFVAIHREKRPLLSQAKAREFFVSLGVERQAVDKAWDAFGVKHQLRQAEAKTRAWRVTGVPAFVVNGKYMVKPSREVDNDTLLPVVDYLIALEKKKL